MFRILLSTCLLAFSLFAAGPQRVATYDRSIWPYTIENVKTFDNASRHEIIQFVKQVNNTPLTNQEEIQAFTNIQNINKKSVQKWLKHTKRRVLKNFVVAQASCENSSGLCIEVSDWKELAELSHVYNINDPLLENWDKEAKKFYSYYLYEQVRLASLFPRITSEIDTLSEKEKQGFDYQDRHFLLTFDDGPKKTLTRQMSDRLSSLDIHGLFFVLGERLENSLHMNGSQHITELYKGQCVGSHGFVHKAHPKLENWEKLYDKTRDMIIINNLQGTKNKTVWFRPPYGQRQSELVKHVHDLKDNVMLWNIDSQDWNQKLSIKNVQDRVETLMLLWRSGIILFHDVHNKALGSIEHLDNGRKNNYIVWDDCRDIISFQN